MKKRVTLIIVAIVVIAVVILLFHDNEEYKSLRKSNVPLKISDEFTGFRDFKIKDDKVFFYCTIALRNTGDKKMKIKIIGDFRIEKERGLIKENYLVGYNPNYPTIEEFYLFPKGSKSKDGKTINSGVMEFPLEFCGTHAGTETKFDRLLPPLIIEVDGEKYRWIRDS